jgi:hypothetical protein
MEYYKPSLTLIDVSSANLVPVPKGFIVEPIDVKDY